MAKKQEEQSVTDEAPETTILEPEQNDPQPESVPPVEEEEGGFPKSVEDTANVIKRNRAGIAAKEKRVAELQGEINNLQNEITVLNSLRQVHGQGPL